MKKGTIVLIVILVVLLFGGCQGVGIYNGLNKEEINVEQAWGNVQSQYQRRADLIPNLVNTVKGAANFEQETLTEVIKARASATQIKVNANDLTPEKLQQFQQAQGELSAALGRLMVVSERYPELKATQNFTDLQVQLEGTENRINTARNDFNTAVAAYNLKVKTFPGSIFAGMFGFSPKAMFEADQDAQKAPPVSF